MKTLQSYPAESVRMIKAVKELFSKEDRKKPDYPERAVGKMLHHMFHNEREEFNQRGRNMLMRLPVELFWRNRGCPAVTVDDGLLSVLENTSVDGPMGEYIREGFRVIGEPVFTVNTDKWAALVCNIADPSSRDRLNEILYRLQDSIGCRSVHLTIDRVLGGRENVMLVISLRRNEDGGKSYTHAFPAIDAYDENRDGVMDLVKENEDAQTYRTVMRLLLYVSLYPETVVIPPYGKLVIPAESLQFVTTRIKMCSPKKEHACPEAHFRRWHFRRYPIQKDGTRRDGIVFVRGCFVNGRQKHVDGSGLNEADVKVCA